MSEKGKVELLPLNLNKMVKARLTDHGRAILEAQSLAVGTPYTPPKEDAEGWSEWQLWDLMSRFGEDLYNGCKVPIETEIRIPLPRPNPGIDRAIEVVGQHISELLDRLKHERKGGYRQDLRSGIYALEETIRRLRALSPKPPADDTGLVEALEAIRAMSSPEDSGADPLVLSIHSIARQALEQGQ